jgi:hypothetical protein
MKSMPPCLGIVVMIDELLSLLLEDSDNDYPRILTDEEILYLLMLEDK